ncbi:MAG: HAD-IA family hydrolase [Solibacillus sp.]
MAKGIFDYHLYIFDLDGTIIDSSELMLKSLAYATKDIEGYIIDEKLFFSQMGKKLEEIFDILGIDPSLAALYRQYSAKHQDEIKVFEEVIAFIKGLKSQNKLVTINTGKEYVRTQKILGEMQLEELFDLVVCSDKLVNSKPHPESIYTTLERLAITKEKTVMIGDSYQDILCAQNAEIDSVFVGWGTATESEIVSLNPTFIILEEKDLSELIHNP